MNEEAFQQIEESSELSRQSPAQFNLFTGVAELIPIEVPEPAEDAREIRIDEGISLVKTDDGSQLILSGFGLFLSKKSERLLVRKGKDLIYQFPLFRLHEVVVGSKGISLSSDLREELRRVFDHVQPDVVHIQSHYMIGEHVLYEAVRQRARGPEGPDGP